MPEVRKVKVQQMDEKCPICQQGWMRPSGIVITGDPPLFQHKRTACGFHNSYNVRYPYTIQ